MPIAPVTVKTVKARAARVRAAQRAYAPMLLESEICASQFRRLRHAYVGQGRLEDSHVAAEHAAGSTEGDYAAEAAREAEGQHGQADAETAEHKHESSSDTVGQAAPDEHGQAATSGGDVRAIDRLTPTPPRSCASSASSCACLSTPGLDPARVVADLRLGEIRSKIANHSRRKRQDQKQGEWVKRSDSAQHRDLRFRQRRWCGRDARLRRALGQQRRRLASHGRDAETRRTPQSRSDRTRSERTKQRLLSHATRGE